MKHWIWIAGMLVVGCVPVVSDDLLHSRPIPVTTPSLVVSVVPTPVVPTVTPTILPTITPTPLPTPNRPSSPTIEIVAGSGVVGYKDGPAKEAQFSSIYGLCLNPQTDMLYVVDSVNYRIRKISPDGVVSTLAGSGERGYQEGSSSQAKFDFPRGCEVDPDGNVLVADAYNGRIRKIIPDGTVSTFSGTGKRNSKDGSLQEAEFVFPQDIAIDTERQVIYVSDWTHIRKITFQGQVSSLAGHPAYSDFANSQGPKARFTYDTRLALDKAGLLYVADHGNKRIRKVDAQGNVTTFAGGGNTQEDGMGENAIFYRLIGIVFNPITNLLYVTDGAILREITLDRKVSTMLILGQVESRLNSSFKGLADIASDTKGDLYIADAKANQVKKIIFPK